MKNSQRFLILFLGLSLLSLTVAHKFYVSVTNIQYSEKEETLQITTRIFIDDLEAVLLERYGAKTLLATDNEIDDANNYIEKYLNQKMVFKVNGQHIPYTFLGKEYDTDIAICYLELPVGPLSEIKTLEIQNDVLTDMFEEQQNVVHFRIADKRRSFVLLRESNKGMLNL
ncbi:MAG: hypothetical protein HKN89_00235 [Eudoraea sp.]|nr:hypothetical protein [Eudoraea sp.]